MKTTILRKKLKEALGLTLPAISHQADLAILANLLIKVGKSSISISATDLEIGVTVKLSGKIEEPGEITVPAQILGEFVSNSTGKKITLKTKGDTLYLGDRRNKAQIKGQPTGDFPQIPEIEQDQAEKIKIPASKLLPALNRVLIATTQDDSRPILAGVLFKNQPRELRLVATDSYRLAEERIVLEEEVKPKQFVVPIKACQEVARILEKEVASSVEVVVAEKQIGFQTNDKILVSRLIEGDYPDYQQIIPDNFQTEVVVNREELLGVAKTAWLFSRDQANSVKLLANPSGQLKISATSPQVGESESRIKLIRGKGPKVEIAFNIKFINDLLSVLKTEKVVLKLNESMQPGMIRGLGLENYLYLIMPLKNE
jgi:DNA polymerase III subunit beta